MADYDDAEDIMGGSRERPAARARVSKANGPIGKAWAWFSVQPAQTKVIIIGVIVVLGVVVWMMFKKAPAKTADDTQDETQPGKFSPLGQMGPGPSGPTGIATFPGAAPLQTAPGQSGPTGIATPGASPIISPKPAVQPLQAAQQVSQPAAYRPPVVPSITPSAMVRARTVVTASPRYAAVKEQRNLAGIY